MKNKIKSVGVGGDKNLLQLRIALKDSDPAIWRRFLVPSDYHLGHLHMAIQMVMGWTNSHLHQFRINGVKYAGPEYQEPPADMKDERTFKLSSLQRNSDMSRGGGRLPARGLRRHSRVL